MSMYQPVVHDEPIDPAQLSLIEPYQKHSPTSREAAEDIRGNAGTLRRRVYEYVKLCGEHGATDEEIQNALEMDGSTERPRRVKLVELGLVQDSGRTRSTTSGRSAVVWVATD